ncbi:MAG: YIP1 family protein [Anaerolineales bacterium]
MQRIIGALTFKRQVYADVEKDQSFNTTAWAIVAGLALITQFGTYWFAAEDTTSAAIAGAVGTLITVAGFAVGAWVIAWLGKAMFKADVTFSEMVRTLGLAYIWNFFGALAALGNFIPLLGCLTAPGACIGWILGLVSYFIATQEALDLDTGQTVITVIAGWVVTFLIIASATFVVGLLGVSAGAAGGLFNFQ